MSEQALSTPIARRAPVINTRGATLRAVYIIWYRDVLRFWRDRIRVATSFAMPVLYLVFLLVAFVFFTTTWLDIFRPVHVTPP